MDNQVTVIERNASMIEAMRTEQDEFSARDLHEFLQVETHFKDWIKRRIEKNDFRENIDYRLVAQKRATNNPKNPFTEINEYILTLDMAKHLALMEQNEQGQQFRNYFILAEKKAKELAKPKRIPPFTLAPATDYVLYNGHRLDVIECEGDKWFYQTQFLKSLNVTHRSARAFEMYGVTTKYGTRRIILIDSLQRIADSSAMSAEVNGVRLFLRKCDPNNIELIESQPHTTAQTSPTNKTDTLLLLAGHAKRLGDEEIMNELINKAMDTV